MNIIIVGAGEIGRHLATELSREAHSIAVIERNPRLAAELEAGVDAKVVAVIILVLTFQNSSNLASAYGIAVTGAVTIDTLLMGLLFVSVWKWKCPRVSAIRSGWPIGPANSRSNWQLPTCRRG